MARIIASIHVVSVAHAKLAAARAAMAGADWVEFRLDRWPLEAPLEPLIAATSLPVLLSCRTPEDGGAYVGTLDDRRRLFERGLDAGAHGLDLELWESWSPRSRHVVVRSHHDFKGLSKNLPELRDRLLEAGDVAKIACMVHDLADATPLFDLLASSDPEREPTVAFGLGERASISRLIACVLGAPFIYASVGVGAETAPGQLPVELVAGLYRARSLSTSTRLGGVLGDPARHSLGPWLHNRALRTAGLDVLYVPLETSRPRDLLHGLPMRRLIGLSVTAPHKETVAKLCHRLTPTAVEVGAVNTVTVDAHGVLVGHNTDVFGVASALRGAGLANVRPGEFGVVVGGGGAARAAAIALRDLGLSVLILARSLDRVRDFARQHGFVVAALREESLAEAGASSPRVLVHATPTGGLGGPPGRVLPGWVPPRGCLVLDMVYRPPRTELLVAAEAAGAVPVSGIEMFLAQAAVQVESFAGSRPSIGDLRDCLGGVADLS